MSRPEAKTRIPHMLIDTDFFEKPENVEAVDKFGDEAPAAIMRLILKLINEKEAKMKKSQVLAMWRASGTSQDKWAEIINYYISCGWLVEEDEWICSIRVGKERARVEQKRSTLSANAKQKQSKSKANDQQNTSKSSDTDTDTDLNINKESSEPLEIPELPPKIANALAQWVQYRQKIGKDMDQQAIDALIMLYAHKIDDLPDDVNHSISSGWKTLNSKPREQARGSPNKKHQQTFEEIEKELDERGIF